MITLLRKIIKTINKIMSMADLTERTDNYEIIRPGLAF